MGDNTITVSRSHHALSALLLIILVACALPSSLPDPTNYSQSAPTRITRTISPSTFPITSTPSIPATIPPTKTVLLPVVTQTPLKVPLKSRPITPSNAGKLILIQKHMFSPWDLVHSIIWSPDGNLLAVAAGEGVHIFEPNTIQEINTLYPGVWTPSIAFSPNSSSIATGGRDGYINLWDVSTGENLYRIEAHRKGVNTVTFSPQGQLIASGGNDAVARLWEMDTGNNVAQMIGGTFAVPAISFTPDGKSLAIVNGQVIRLRDVASSRFVITINGEASFNTIDISPDGLILAAGDSVNMVTLWDISGSGFTQTPRIKLDSPNQPQKLVWQVKFSPDGQILASAHNDGTVNLWEVSTGKFLTSLSGPSKAITSLAFSPDGHFLAAGSLDGSLSIWAATP